MITVIFGVLWLSSSAAWANGLTGLKYVTDSEDAHKCDAYCSLSVGSFSTLNISVVGLGYLHLYLFDLLVCFAGFWILKLLFVGFRSVVPLQRDCLVPRSKPSRSIWSLMQV